MILSLRQCVVIVVCRFSGVRTAIFCINISVRYQLSPQDVWDIFFLADAEVIKKEAREA